MCVFVRFCFGASISFPHLFLRSLNKVHRSSVVAHGLIYPIFIHRILLFLGLDDFPTGELIHIIAPIGATISFPHLFLRSLNEVHRSSSTAYALFSSCVHS